MANQIICVLAESYGLRLFSIMLPPSDFSVAYCLGYETLFRAYFMKHYFMFIYMLYSLKMTRTIDQRGLRLGDWYAYLR